MTPMQLIFKVFSDLSGGLITDISTAMVGMLTIGIILMGFDYLKDVFETGMSERRTVASLERARGYRELADSSNLMKDQTFHDYNEAKYRNEIRKAAQ